MPEAVEEKTSAAIAAVNKQFMEGVAKGDAAQVAAVYASDGWAFPPGGPIVKGREAVQGLWQSVIDSGIKGIDLETLDLDVHGDGAVEVGQGVLRLAGGQVAGRAKYIVVWKRVTGEWKYYRDIWNDMPA
ncbi:MAG: YybH family protein [Nitrososphaerales archaeon]